MSDTLHAGTERDTEERLPVLEVDDLRVRFPEASRDWFAVDGVSFRLQRGKTLGIVGESGSGKSVTAKAIMGLLGKARADVTGSIRFEGRDLAQADVGTLRRIRGREIALVFQDPMRSLNPTMRIGIQVGEPLRLHLGLSRREARARALELLDSVRIPAATRRIDEYPHQLSGGMRQRVMIAMALACGPKLLIADEPTTALDVTTQAQIMDLLRDLQEEYGMAMILISHDIELASEYTDDIAVMYAGRVVERAPSQTIFDAARMPYTEALFQSIPRLDQRSHSRLAAIEGAPPGPGALLRGCRFEPRCKYRQVRCVEEAPPLEESEPNHAWACWFPL
jgi:oligopeptide/dipeptide ABC transporter ATP-binding protein